MQRFLLSGFISLLMFATGSCKKEQQLEENPDYSSKVATLKAWLQNNTWDAYSGNTHSGVTIHSEGIARFDSGGTGVYSGVTLIHDWHAPPPYDSVFSNFAESFLYSFSKAADTLYIHNGKLSWTYPLSSATPNEISYPGSYGGGVLIRRK
jgi:hypothetical protein